MYIAFKKTVFFVSGGAIGDDSDTKSLIPKYLKLTNLISVKTPHKRGFDTSKYNIYAKKYATLRNIYKKIFGEN